MHLIVGLGNPGTEYEGTRHNLGFAVIDAIAEFCGIRLRAGKGEFLIGSKGTGGDRLLLMKPLTYVNNSGEAVSDALRLYGLSPAQLLVVVDDFHLPLGTLRLRPAGSDGGHNGLYSIIYQTQTDEFPRLRCGIGGEMKPERKSDTAQFVLSAFAAGEQKTVHRMIVRARDAALTVVTEGLEAAMSRFNTPETK